MLIVAGHFEVDPESRDQFLADRVDNVAASRAEPGCITYALSADPIEPGRVLLYERWESKEALATHLQALRSAPAAAHDIQILGAELQQYEISQVGPIGS
jgi:quinol monooxygenase YgiN